jgi:hypothetical protein
MATRTITASSEQFGEAETAVRELESAGIRSLGG